VECFALIEFRRLFYKLGEAHVKAGFGQRANCLPKALTWYHGRCRHGWLLSNFQSAHQLLVLADIAALIVICFGVYAIHKRIESKIAQLEEL